MDNGLRDVFMHMWACRSSAKVRALPEARDPLVLAVSFEEHILYFAKTSDGWIYTDKVDGVSRGSAVDEWLTEQVVEQEILG